MFFLQLPVTISNNLHIKWRNAVTAALNKPGLVVDMGEFDAPWSDPIARKAEAQTLACLKDVLEGLGNESPQSIEIRKAIVIKIADGLAEFNEELLSTLSDLNEAIIIAGWHAKIEAKPNSVVSVILAILKAYYLLKDGDESPAEAEAFVDIMAGREANKNIQLQLT